jgi:HEAT repeat protein
MRLLAPVLMLASVMSVATAASSQQPQIVHAQLTTQAVDHGLNAALDGLKKQDSPLWIAYSFPVVDKFSSGWNSGDTEYLESGHSDEADISGNKDDHTSGHAVLLLRVANGAVVKLRVEAPNRKLDAGGLRLIWLTGVAPDDSVHFLKALAMQNDTRQLMDSAVFAISLHQTTAATPALVDLAAAGHDPKLREKAAFWLAIQRGHDGFMAIQRFAHEDTNPDFRKKLVFDLTLCKEPAALTELIRMAHEDSSPDVRRQAQFWMASKGGKLVSQDLREVAAKDPDAQVRKSAVFALSRLPGDEAATQLIQVASSSKDPGVRKQAVFWLGQSSDPRALDYLTRLLQK